MAIVQLKSGADAVFENISGGSVLGENKTSNFITVGNPITGGTFSNLTFREFLTNTATTKHLGAYNNVDMRLTNAGIVEFDSAATGTVVFTEGPQNDQVVLPFNGGVNRWRVLSNGTVNIVKDNATIYAGVTPNGGLTNYTPPGEPNKVWQRGAKITQTNYILIETDLKRVTVNPGGLDYTIAPQSSTNNVQNIIIAESPFIVNIHFPTSGHWGIRSNGTTAYGSGEDPAVFDEASLDRGDTIEVAYVEPGFSMFYQTYIVEDLIYDGVQEITITPAVEPYPSLVSVPSETVIQSIMWNSTTELLELVIANVVQDEIVMNRLLTESINNNMATVVAILHFGSSDIYGSEGAITYFRANTDRVQITTSTGLADNSEETLPYFRPTNVVLQEDVEDAQRKLGQGEWLGQSFQPKGLSAEEIFRRFQPALDKISKFVPLNGKE